MCSDSSKLHVLRNAVKEYIEMELKLYFIIFEEFTKWQKQNNAIITFK